MVLERRTSKPVWIATLYFILLLTIVNFLPHSFREVYANFGQQETGDVAVTQRIL